MRTFLLKAKHFFKRNIYPITVTMCTALVLGIIAVSAYSAIKSSEDNVTVNTEIPVESGTIIGDKINDKNDTNDDDDDSKHTSSEVIIFDLPFAGATITKEYTDTSLLYDKTSKFWCTHQGLDFACTERQQVVAVYSGTITKIENSMMNGTVVYLKVSDELTVVYKGLASDVSVKEGDKVSKGQLIGCVSTILSENADGIHLHLEVLKNNELKDPTEYFSTNK